MILESMNEHAKHAGDALSVGTLIGIFVANLPTVTAVLVAIWTGMRIYESYLKIKLHRRNLAAAPGTATKLIDED